METLLFDPNFYAAIWVVVTSIVLIIAYILQFSYRPRLSKSVDWGTYAVYIIALYTVSLILFIDFYLEII